MLLLTSTFLIIYTDQYVNEKKILKETETILKTEYYFLYSVRKVESCLQNGELMLSSGEVSLQDGKMSYTIEDLGSTLKITFNLKLNSGETLIGFAYYNKNVKKMIKWVEKN